MNLILLFKEDFIENTKTVLLHGRRLEHVRDVLRSRSEDELCVGLVEGLIGTGRVIRIEKDVLEMEVDLSLMPPEPVPLTLILALPRPKFLRRLLFSITAMGVKKIIFINSYRVEKSFWYSPALNEKSLKEYLVLGLEQARDTILPEVRVERLFRPFVEDILPGLMQNSLALVAHPKAQQPCPREVNREVILAIGPEGGFIPYEVERLVECGFMPVQIGTRPLPVETAVPVLISRLF